MYLNGPKLLSTKGGENNSMNLKKIVIMHAAPSKSYTIGINQCAIYRNLKILQLFFKPKS